MLILLVGTGIFLSLRLSFLQFSQLPIALKTAFSRKQDKQSVGDISHFQSLMTALAATIGTGNIAGVATAVVAGEPGAIFWMWMTAIFGMATKYAEAILAVKYRGVGKRGEWQGVPCIILNGVWDGNGSPFCVLFLVQLPRLGLAAWFNPTPWRHRLNKSMDYGIRSDSDYRDRNSRHLQWFDGDSQPDWADWFIRCGGRGVKSLYQNHSK